MYRFLFIIYPSLWSLLFSHPHPLCVCLSVCLLLLSRCTWVCKCNDKLSTSWMYRWRSWQRWLLTRWTSISSSIYLPSFWSFSFSAFYFLFFCITLCFLYFSPSFYFFHSLLCIIPPLLSLKLFYLHILVALSCVCLLSHIMLKDIVFVIFELFICRFVDNSLSFLPSSSIEFELSY